MKQPTTDPLSTAIRAEETRLRERLVAAGPLTALEAGAVVGEFARVATAWRLAWVGEPRAATLPPAAFAEALAAEAEVLLASAEARATAALRGARETLLARLEAERRKAVWAQGAHR